MHLIPYDKIDTGSRLLFYKFLKEASKETTQPAHINMWHKNWTTQPHTLPYILLNEDRFNMPSGQFFLLKKDNAIIGCSGVYISEFSSNVCIGGCRTWIAKEYRNNSLVRDYFLPVQKEWAIQNNIKSIALSFNQYNKNIINIWKRFRFGESRTPRESRHIFFNDFNEVPFLVTVQYTPQWIIYEKLDPTFHFDWQNIKY